VSLMRLSPIALALFLLMALRSPSAVCDKSEAAAISCTDGMDAHLLVLQQREPTLSYMQWTGDRHPLLVTASAAENYNDTAPADLLLFHLHLRQLNAAKRLRALIRKGGKPAQVCAREADAIHVVVSRLLRTFDEERMEVISVPVQKKNAVPAVGLFDFRSVRLRLLAQTLHLLAALLRGNVASQSELLRLLPHKEDPLDRRGPGANWHLRLDSMPLWPAWTRCTSISPTKRPESLAFTPSANGSRCWPCVTAAQTQKLLALVESVHASAIVFVHAVMIAEGANAELKDEFATGKWCLHLLTFHEHWKRGLKQEGDDTLQQRFPSPTMLAARAQALRVVAELLQHERQPCAELRNWDWIVSNMQKELHTWTMVRNFTRDKEEKPRRTERIQRALRCIQDLLPALASYRAS